MPIVLMQRGETTNWRKKNKFMIQEETENIKEWKVYSSY